MPQVQNSEQDSSSSTSKSVDDSVFKESLLEGLNKLRKDETLCDVVLKIDDLSFPAHKNILCAASQFFKALFNNCMRESQAQIIDLGVVEEAVIEDILSYIYTGKINLHADNVREILVSADYLLMDSLKAEAAKFLESTLQAENCLAIWDFSRKYHCHSLADNTFKYVSERFEDISLQDSFKSLSFTDVQLFVSSDDILVSSEEDVLRTVLQWVKNDESSRKHHLRALLEQVRFYSLSKYAIQAYLKEEPLIAKDLECTQLFIAGLELYAFPDSMLKLNVNPRKCLKNFAKVILLVGGHVTPPDDYSSKLIAFRPPENNWYSVLGAQISRTRHAATICEGDLYVVGGEPTWKLGHFDHRVGSWSFDMHQFHGCSVKQTAAVTHQGMIYVIGGESGVEATAKGYEYDPKTNEWCVLDDMLHPRCAHVAVCIENLIFVVGGYNGNDVYKSGECYDIMTNEWTAIPDMQCKRRFAAGCSLNSKLFIAGGYEELHWIAYSSCEIYDPATGHWGTIADMTIPRAACGIACIENQIYLFAGENGSGDAGKIKTVDRYDANNDAWDVVGTMPGKSSCLQACVIYLPCKSLMELD